MNRATGSETNPVIGFPAFTRARISVLETSTRRVRSRRIGNASRAAGASASPRASTTISASDAICCGSRQLAICAARSSPISRKSAAPAFAAASAASVSAV